MTGTTIAVFAAALHEDGPEAIEQAIHQRDIVIAKLMHKLGVTEITLHSENDPPDVRVPFGCRWDVDENDPKKLTIAILSPRMN